MYSEILEELDEQDVMMKLIMRFGRDEITEDEIKEGLAIYGTFKKLAQEENDVQ